MTGLSKWDHVWTGRVPGMSFAKLGQYVMTKFEVSPQLIVLKFCFCLKIIDFDIAMQVEDEDEEVNDQSGSEHWMAPEVENKSMYSPIKADRWSIGKVLFYLFRELEEEDKYLRSIAEKLTARSPNRRLSMLEIAPPVSNVANVVGYAKVLRSLQVIPEGDEENAKPPKKRRKVLVDRNERVVLSELPMVPVRVH